MKVSLGGESGNKYGARKTSCGKHIHDSNREAQRCAELRLMEKGRLIADLIFQPAFPMWYGDNLICTYVADFMYHEEDELVVEDVKGKATDSYIIKRKMLKAFYGITVRET